MKEVGENARGAAIWRVSLTLPVSSWHGTELSFYVGCDRGPRRRRGLGLAVEPMARLAESTQAGGTDFGLGIESRSRALLGDGDTAERLYREAIERLARTRYRPDLARAHLLYGEWLRRDRRRTDARAQLHGPFGIKGRGNRSGTEPSTRASRVPARVRRPDPGTVSA